MRELWLWQWVVEEVCKEWMRWRKTQRCRVVHVLGIKGPSRGGLGWGGHHLFISLSRANHLVLGDSQDQLTLARPPQAGCTEMIFGPVNRKQSRVSLLIIIT